jgi:hypothetical protein
MEMLDVGPIFLELFVKAIMEEHKFRSTDEFVAGWTAAFINTTALFPINKLIFRQMAGGHGAQKAADQMKEEGEYKARRHCIGSISSYMEKQCN